MVLIKSHENARGVNLVTTVNGQQQSTASQWDMDKISSENSMYSRY